MKKTAIKLMLLLVCTSTFPAIIYAEESGTAAIKNPFLPQLPEKKVEPPVIEAVRESSQPIETTISMPETSTPVQEEIVPPTMTITGLVWNTSRPQAIINGQVVDIGDTVEEARVVAIRKNEIDVLFQGTTLTIKL